MPTGPSRSFDHACRTSSVVSAGRFRWQGKGRGVRPLEHSTSQLLGSEFELRFANPLTVGSVCDHFLGILFSIVWHLKTRVSQSPEGAAPDFDIGDEPQTLQQPTLSQSPEGAAPDFDKRLGYFDGPKVQCLNPPKGRRLISTLDDYCERRGCTCLNPPKGRRLISTWRSCSYLGDCLGLNPPKGRRLISTLS